MGKGFKELLVWQKSRDLAVEVYQITQENPWKRDYGLTDQVRRSAVSVPSNIAEGDERDSDKEAIRFFYISKGSLAELRTQLDIAHKIEYLPSDTFQNLDSKAKTIAKMLGGLIKARAK